MTAPKPDPVQTALDSYGAVGTWVQSQPGLRGLFDTAVAQGWDATRFERELWNTQWWKTLTDAQKQQDILRATNPAQYDSQMGEKAAEIALLGQGLGLNVGDTYDLARQSIAYSWTPEILREHLIDTFGSRQVNGMSTGSIGDYANNVRTTFEKYGVRMNDDFYNFVGREIAAGRQTTGGMANEAIGYASTLYPQYTERFKAGITLADIAQPYIQAMGQTLEVDPSNISLHDTTIQQALQGDGKNPTTMWQFQQQLKQDPRWGTTQNAKNAAADTITKIGQDWGFIK